jgi:hypothetical protein
MGEASNVVSKVAALPCFECGTAFHGFRVESEVLSNGSKNKILDYMNN